jgi:uncharacterized protein YbjT (DUF2867 family)
MKIAIAGGTGLTGRLCLERLLENPSISQVFAIGRRPTGREHAKLREVVLVDGRPLEAIRVDGFVSCLGTTRKKAGSAEGFLAVDLELPLRLAKELNANGCRVAAVVSALGANPSSPFLYPRTKGRMEQGMEAVGFDSLSLLRPSLIAGSRAEKRTAETLALAALRVLQPILRGPLKEMGPVPAESIARALVKLVLEGKPGCSVYSSATLNRMG